jgi:CelD/BcsL family acetyltransferase involved in cellulose biosynthesis
MKVEVIRDFDQFLALESDWRELFERVHSSYLAQSFGWCLTGWEVIAKPQGYRLSIVTLRDEGRLVLVWPLVERRAGIFSVLRPLGSGCWGDHCNLLVEEDENELWRIAFVLTVLKRIGGFDLLNLLQVRSNTALHKLLAQDPKCKTFKEGLWLQARKTDSWGNYWKSRPRKLRRSDGQGAKLSARGEIGFEVITDSQRIDKELDWVLEHKRHSIQRLNLRSPWLFTDYYREFLRRMSVSGGLVMFVLTLDGVTIAAELGCLERQRVEGMIKTYDRDYATYAVGQQLTKRMVQWAFERDLEYDMRIGDEPYKEDWANQRGTVSIFMKPLSWKGKFLPFLFPYLEDLKGLLRHIDAKIR